MSTDTIVFDDVSKFYGEVLGVNRVNLEIGPGVTSLVGPNGSGKTTLMNLMTGLLRPTRGAISVLGMSPYDPERIFERVGYCSQFDSFPASMTGFDLVSSYLNIRGFDRAETERRTWSALERVSLVEAANRKCAGYSKGMRQRVRLAQAIAHDPNVLILDEPLNGLDPLARAEVIALFRQLASAGMYLILSSHILHEVDMMSDRVILMTNGYVVAEGDIHGVRTEMEDHPLQILVRCDRPSTLAARLFANTEIVEARVHDDRQGLYVKTRDIDGFYDLLNEIILEGDISVESVAPVDDDLSAVYSYLIGSEGGRA